MVTFTITNGVLLGTGNGNPVSHEMEQIPQRSLFNGLAQLIVQTREGSSGFMEITASAPGLKPATLRIPIINKKPWAYVN